MVDLIFGVLTALSAVFQLVLVVGEAGVPGENHRPWTSNSGSLVLHVEINNLCFITKDSLYKAIVEFLRRVFTSISGSLDQHIMEVVLTECDSYIISGLVYHYVHFSFELIVFRSRAWVGSWIT